MKAAERSRIELQLKGSRNGSGSFATTRRVSSLARCMGSIELADVVLAALTIFLICAVMLASMRG